MRKKLGIWIVRAEAETLGRFVETHLGGVLNWPVAASSNREAFAAAFDQYEQWILIMTTGIAVRYLDGLPQNKKTDPGVVVLDEGSRFAVSLLGGHEGG